MELAEHADLVRRLAEAPVWLRAALSAGQARVAAVATGEWGVADVIHHVRAADAILSTRIFQILVREAAPLPAFDERAWGKLLAVAAISPDQQVAQFALRRAELVEVLRSLAPEQWQMAGRHELTGGRQGRRRVGVSRITSQNIGRSWTASFEGKRRSGLTRPTRSTYDRGVTLIG